MASLNEMDARMKADEITAMLGAEPSEPEDGTQVGQKRKVSEANTCRRWTRGKQSTSTYLSFPLTAERDDTVMILKERVRRSQSCYRPPELT